MIKMTIQDTEETAEFKVLEKPIIQKPLIAESDVVTIDNNLSTYVTGTQKRELTVGLGYLDSVGYETLRRIRDRQYAVLKYPTVTITADEPVDLGYGEDVPDYRQRLVQLKGKNLLDSTTLVAGYVLNTGLFSGNSQLGEMCSGFIEVTPNTTYTFSIQATTSSYDNWFGVGEYTTSDTSGFIQRITQTTTTATAYTFTTSATCRYIVVSARNLADATKLQLELSSTVTPYSSYFEPIELCKIGDYQDRIYKSGDKWYLHKEVLKYQLTGSETYTTRTNTSTTHGKYRITNAVLASNIAGEAALSCSHFVANVGANEAAYSENAICGSLSSGYQKMLWFSIANSIVASLDAFKTWVTNNMPTVYYAIATPTETEITNETLIAQLDALQNSAFDRWTQIETNVQEPSLQPYLTVTQGDITGSGKEVMLEGTTEDLLDFVIFGDTFQQTYSGKNLLNLNAARGTNSGTDYTFDYSTQTLTLTNSTASADNRYSGWYIIGIPGGSQVTFSMKSFTNSAMVGNVRRIMIRSYNGSTATVLGNIFDATTLSLSVTLPFDSQRVEVFFYVVSGSVASTSTITEPMLEISSTATAFEPYVGGTASPNPDYPQTVQTVGGDINFDFSGPSGIKTYTMVGKMTLADQRIIDNCGTNEQVQVSFRESKQI